LVFAHNRLAVSAGHVHIGDEYLANDHGRTTERPAECYALARGIATPESDVEHWRPNEDEIDD
jgi:hypothetical protein